jgi:hypothetical protein
MESEVVGWLTGRINSGVIDHSSFIMREGGSRIRASFSVLAVKQRL